MGMNIFLLCLCQQENFEAYDYSVTDTYKLNRIRKALKNRITYVALFKHLGSSLIKCLDSCERN